MAFHFEAAVQPPFRMQPGLRRLAPGAVQLTPMQPGSRHQREKLAVLSAFWPQALCAVPGFDARPALDAICAHAAAEHPGAWSWREGTAAAAHLGVAVGAGGAIQQLAAGSFGLGDEISRCLEGLPAHWRQPALLSLAFAEDFAVLHADGTVPWMAVCLPSHWAPEHKVGGHFTQIHAPVADNTLLLKAADSLVALVTRADTADRWERFVWNVTDSPRLHAHPSRTEPRRWAHTGADAAWFRSERQTFVPVARPEGQPAQAVFTIHVEVQALADVLHPPGRAAALHAAIGSMSPAVLAYRGLGAMQAPLLEWLAERAAADGQPV
jgi:dimethylamine monooxygenase subunit A